MQYRIEVFDIDVAPEIIKVFKQHKMVGSRTILGASNPGSDYDILCHVWSKRLAERKLEKLGFYTTSVFSMRLSPYHFRKHSPFIAMRNEDNVNLIITSSRKFYTRFLDANTVAQNLGLTNKEDRITLFQYILYGRHR